MQLSKITTLLLGAAIAFTPLHAISATKTKTVQSKKTAIVKNEKKTKVSTHLVKKADEKKTTKPAEKKAKSSKENAKKSVKTAAKKADKAHHKTQKTVEKAKAKKQSAKTAKHHKKATAKNETKQLYGVKGAKLAHTKVSNRVYSYREKGKTYSSINKELSRLFSQTGVASYYGGMFHGRKTANGEIFNKNAYTAAHKTLALGSYALVTNLRNGRKVIVRINDRGPFSKSRIIDLSIGAAREIGMIHSGVAKVRVEAMQVDKQGYISGKGAESLYKLAKREVLSLKVKGEGKNFAIKAE